MGKRPEGQTALNIKMSVEEWVGIGEFARAVGSFPITEIKRSIGVGLDKRRKGAALREPKGAKETRTEPFWFPNDLAVELKAAAAELGWPIVKTSRALMLLGGAGTHAPSPEAMIAYREQTAARAATKGEAA